MAMGIKPRQEKVLNGDHINLLWLQLGTLRKVGERLTQEGLVSPRTGSAFSNPALAMSNWRWCVRNPDESFERVMKYRKAAGVYMTRLDWDKELILHARQVLTPAGYDTFLEKNGLKETARSV